MQIMSTNILNNQPTASILMAVYNREKYLREAVDSILSQTFADFELIIADDGSTDNSLAIAREYKERDPRVRVLALEHRGLVAVRNSLVHAANLSSRFLMNHDSDDISLPEKLATLVQYLEGHPEIAIVGCQAEKFDDDGNDLGLVNMQYTPGQIRATFGELNSMVNSATMVRREVFQKIGCYRKAFPVTEDYDLWSRALKAGFELANIPTMLHRIRIHPESISNKKKWKLVLLHDLISSDYDFYYETKCLGRFPLFPFLNLINRKIAAYWHYFQKSQIYRQIY
jgi:glycosyltransferase involved in cell wall biosynthesis